ncbi:MAG: FMN-binding protein [Rikenellaceae bacterium]
MERLKYLLNIAIVAMMFIAIAIGRDGRIAGTSAVEIVDSSSAKKSAPVVPIESVLSDGTIVLNSTTPGAKISGFGGRTPIMLYVKEGVIQRLELGKNSETPSFLEEVERAGLYQRWNGMTVAEAATAKVDGVSGATYSSDAIIKNVQLVAQESAKVSATGGSFLNGALTLKNIIGLIVIALGVAITLARPENKKLIIGQWALNVTVLGFWCGSFLSLGHFTSFAANGFNFAIALLPITLLAVVIIMPLLGRKGSYCHLHCPMGSAQDLLNKVPTPKYKIKPEITKHLTKVRYYILFTLLFMMWCGVGFELMDYEIFSAFIVKSASNVVLTMAAVFLLLSLFIPKPYCRFVCPTGALLTVGQKTDETF